MSISIAQYLDVLQLPPALDEYKQVPKHPSRIIGVCGRVGETDVLVLGFDVAKKSLLKTREGSYDPLKA